jgi:hypothetical protein
MPMPMPKNIAKRDAGLAAKRDAKNEWLRKVDRVEPYTASPYDYYRRATFNGLEGNAQDDYMARLRAKAAKPHFRAWRGETFWVITASEYAWACAQGIPHPPDASTP